MVKNYKYRPISQFLVDELNQSYLTFASPFVLNDMYDCQVPVDVSLRVDDFVGSIASIVDDCAEDDGAFGEFIKSKILPKSSDARLAYFRKVLLDLVGRQRITCFTDSFDNQPMWAHYSANHSGVCLEFTIEREPDTLWHYLAEVQYVHDIPTLVYPRSLNDESDFAIFLNSLFLTKHDKWSYESEIRLMLDKQSLQGTSNDCYHKLHYDERCLSAVYFGYRLDETNEQYKNLMEILRSRAVCPRTVYRRRNEHYFGGTWDERQ